MEQLNSPGRTRTLACRCSWHPPTGSGSSRSDTFPHENKPLWTESLASLSRASPNARRRSVRTKTKSIWETASTTYPHYKKSFRKRKRSRGRKATQSPPKQCVKQSTSKWGPWLKWRTCDPFKRFVEWKRGRFTRDVHQCWEIIGCRFNPITKHFIYLKT